MKATAMKYLLLTVLALVGLGVAGCKDAPIDPSTSTAIIGGTDTTGGGGGGHDNTPGQDDCLECGHSTARQIFPYFGFVVKAGPTNDTLDLTVRQPVRLYSVATLPNKFPKSIALDVQLEVPGNFYSGAKEVRRIDLYINEQLNFVGGKASFRLRNDPATEQTGMAILYRVPFSADMRRLSTGDSVEGTGFGHGHAEATFKVEKVDLPNRTLVATISGARFMMLPPDQPRNVDIAPITVRMYY